MAQIVSGLRIAAVALLTLALNACASLQGTACNAGEQLAIHDTLYFGTGIPEGGVVSADAWSMFLATAVTPKFPQGFTVSEASGQWRGNDGSIVKETSYVLQLVHSDDGTSEQAVVQIVSAYKTEFRQEAVLRVKARACTSF
jgi:hypothetical protein